MVALAFDEAAPRATLRPLKGHEAFRWLRTSLFRLVIDEPAVDVSDFAKVAALYEAAPLFELRRRPHLDELKESAELLLAEIDRLRPTGGTL